MVSRGFLRSIVITIFLSFIAPIFLAITIFSSLILVGFLPGVAEVTMAGTLQCKHFLAVFGSGCPFEGLLIISTTCSLVAALFDTYAFYRYQTLRGH